MFGYGTLDGQSVQRLFKGKTLMDNAQKEADLLEIRANNDEIGRWESEGLNKYDAQYRMVYHHVNYDIQEIELEL